MYAFLNVVLVNRYIWAFKINMYRRKIVLACTRNRHVQYKSKELGRSGAYHDVHEGVPWLEPLEQ